MLNKQFNYPMAEIPSGTEVIRHYHDENQWISSNSQMSTPGKRYNMKETTILTPIEPFLIGCYPVTKGFYYSVMEKELGADNDHSTPVVNVSWLDAVKFCNILSKKMGLDNYYTIDYATETAAINSNSNGYRLPTDAEWQYACKAGSNKYQYGPIEDIAWYKGNSENKIHEVGLKQPNAWNLYDMIGNVWEWCWDLYNPATYGTYRIFRGGSWAEAERGCGATCRRRSMPSFFIDDLGFRLAKNI